MKRDDLDELVDLKVQLFELLHSLEKNEFIVLSSDFFSKKLLWHLYKLGAFKGNGFNNYNPYQDYQFMLDMFSKRKRTQKQEKKATAIIMNSISLLHLPDIVPR